MAWHPAKRQILITTSLGSAPQLYSVDGPLRYRRQLTWTDRGVPMFSSVVVRPGGSQHVSLPVRSRRRRIALALPLRPGERRVVARDDIEDPLSARVVARQGKWVAFDSAERNGKDRDLYVMPADRSRHEAPGRSKRTGAWSPQDWSPDGSTHPRQLKSSPTPRPISGESTSRPARRRRSRRATARRRPGSTRDFPRTGRQVYAVSDRAGGEFRIWRCDLAKCVWSAGHARRRSRGLSSTGRHRRLRAVARRHVARRRRRSRFDHRAAAHRSRLRSKARAACPIPIGRRDHAVALAPGIARDRIHARIGEGAGRRVFRGRVPRHGARAGRAAKRSFNADVLPAPEVIEWKSFDGTVISGILYRPAAKFTGPRPVMVNIHGGPDIARARALAGAQQLLPQRDGDRDRLSERPRIVAASAASSSRWTTAGAASGAIKDIGALLDWIGTRPDLDKNRVDAHRRQLRRLARARGRDRLQRSDPLHHRGRRHHRLHHLPRDAPMPARQENRRQEFGDERDPQMREFLKSISPVTRAADLKKPTFILHPGKDIRVPVGQAQRAAARRSRRTTRPSGTRSSPTRITTISRRPGQRQLDAGGLDRVREELLLN